MSLWQASATWVRHHLGWSTSRQSWEERAGLALLLAGVAGLWWYGSSLSALAQVILWSLLGLTAALLLRRGWLKLFGPVLFYDMICLARRGRYFGVRCFYAGLLLFFLFTAYVNTNPYGLTPAQRAGRFAENYFFTFMTVQIICVLLLTPAYVAGSIAEEKTRKTLEFLLATDLRNREIVLSKLGARLANLSLFILTGLPILSLLQFLGGVDPNLVLGGFAATGLTAAGLAGFSILNSVTFKRPRDAYSFTYLGAVTYLLLSLLFRGGQAARWGIFATPIMNDMVDAFNSGNIFLTMEPLGRAAQMGTLDTVLPALLGRYALFHGLVFLVCTSWAVLRLRRVAIRQFYGQARTRSRRSFGWARPPVGEPMLWKELFVETGIRFTLPVCIIVLLLLAATILPGAWILFNWLTEPDLANRWGGLWNIAREMSMYVRFTGTGVACLLLLAVAVRAASSISSERDRQTFDALLTTPMDSVTMLWAKWLGSILSIRLGWIWLGLIYAMGVVTGGLHVFALPIVVTAWMVFAGVVAMIGLWYSMVSRSTMRATVWTLFTTAGLTVGHWMLWLLCLPLLVGMGPRSGVEEVMKFQAGMTPPASLFILTFMGDDFRAEFGRNEMVEMAFFSLFGVVAWAVGGLAFWHGALSPRFRTLTGRNDFRIPEGRAPRGRGRPRDELEPTDAETSEGLPQPHRTEIVPQNAILLEETWDPPTRKPPQSS